MRWNPLRLYWLAVCVLAPAVMIGVVACDDSAKKNDAPTAKNNADAPDDKLASNNTPDKPAGDNPAKPDKTNDVDALPPAETSKVAGDDETPTRTVTSAEKTVTDEPSDLIEDADLPTDLGLDVTDPNAVVDALTDAAGDEADIPAPKDAVDATLDALDAATDEPLVEAPKIEAPGIEVPDVPDAPAPPAVVAPPAGDVGTGEAPAIVNPPAAGPDSDEPLALADRDAAAEELADAADADDAAAEAADAAANDSGDAIEAVLSPSASLRDRMLDEAGELARAKKIVGPEAPFENNCNTCHTKEVEAWQHTRHYLTYKDRHRSPEAQAILDNMGIRSMKRSGDCRQCHYTSIERRGRIMPAWGVSCESCHGPAAEWVTFHNKAGGDPNAKALEMGQGQAQPAEQRKTRLAKAVDKGMIHSEMTYNIARNCYSCHTVPNETIVNKGKHKAGSDFDLVAWSQGEVRHNFLTGAGGNYEAAKNAPGSQNRLRRLYTIGAIVDLEVSLYNLANVKEKGGDFHKAMVERVNKARAKVAKIAEAADIAEVKAVLEKVPATVDESTSVSGELADEVGKAGRVVSAKYSGEQLAGVDPLLPAKDQYKGTPHNE